MIGQDMFLTQSDIDASKITAIRLADALIDLPEVHFLSRIQIALSAQNGRSMPEPVMVEFPCLSWFPGVQSILDVTGSTPGRSGFQIEGLVEADPDFPTWQRTRLLATVATRPILQSLQLGVIAHELTHCLAFRSAGFNQAAWNSAGWLSKQARANTGVPEAYQAYVLHPYEAHAHATQIVAMLVDQHGKQKLSQPSGQFEQSFKSSPVAMHIKAYHGQTTAQGQSLVDALWQSAPGILNAV